MPPPPTKLTDCSVKYTIDASLVEGTRTLTPFSVRVSANDRLGTFTFTDLLVPPSGKQDNDTSPTKILFTGTVDPTQLPVPEPQLVNFLAIVPSDPSQAKSQAFAVAAEAVTPTFPDLPLREGSPLVETPPDKLAQTARQNADKAAAGKLLFAMPEGGLVFVGPAARLLVKALDEKKPQLLIWNLSRDSARIGLIIGHRDS